MSGRGIPTGIHRKRAYRRRKSIMTIITQAVNLTITPYKVQAVCTALVLGHKRPVAKTGAGYPARG
ncbi:hypothetical protein ACLK17_22895 [Escherichia coli]